MATENAQKLIDYLAATHDYVSSAKLEKQFSISRWTVFYRIDQANKLLAQLGLAPIENERGVGYQLPENSASAWRKRQQTQGQPDTTGVSLQERLDGIIWTLLTRTEPQSINSLVNQFGVTRNTIIADFKRIEAEYASLKLVSTPKGHLLAGDEETICRYVFRQVSQDDRGTIARGIDQLSFPAMDMKVVRKQLNTLEGQTGTRLT